MSSKDGIHAGFTAVTPYLYARPELLDFIQRAFGAEVSHHEAPDSAGRFHAEAKIGGAPLLLGSGWFADPSMAAAIYLYVPDVDATYRRALEAGATSVREPADQAWGDRVCGVKDGSGNTWWIATHKA